MKLSSVTVLLSAAVAALPGASAATVSLRGILPEAEELAAFANCDTKTNCPSYGQNSCETIDNDCDGQCFWDGSDCEYPDDNDNGPNRSCRTYTSRNSCQNNDCDWINNSCRNPSYTFRCSDYDNNRSTCQNKGCSWLSSTDDCVLICSNFDNTNRNKCEKSGLCTYKNNGNCDISECSDLDDTSEEECEDNTFDICRWNNNKKECSLNNNQEEVDFEEKEE